MTKSPTTPGRYQHYKGGFYEVLGIALHSETQQEHIVYRALYDSGQFPKDTLWVRPRDMFEETVLVEGKNIPRFQKIVS